MIIARVSDLVTVALNEGGFANPFVLLEQMLVEEDILLQRGSHYQFHMI